MVSKGLGVSATLNMVIGRGFKNTHRLGCLGGVRESGKEKGLNLAIGKPSLKPKRTLITKRRRSQFLHKYNLTH